MDLPITPGLPLLPPVGDPAALATSARTGDGRGTEEVARGFEGMFAALLIKQMRQGLEPGSLFGEDRGDVLGGLFDQYMGQHLATAGGLGIAAMIRQNLQAPGPR